MGPALVSCAVFMLDLAAGRVDFVLDGMPHWLLVVYTVLRSFWGRSQFYCTGFTFLQTPGAETMNGLSSLSLGSQALCCDSRKGTENRLFGSGSARPELHHMHKSPGRADLPNRWLDAIGNPVVNEEQAS